MSHPDRHGQTPPPTREINFAGFIIRLLGYIIDTIFITLVALVIGFGAAIIWELDNEVTGSVISSAAGIVTLFYVLGFWAMAGGTPGKIMLGMRIVGPDGSTNGIGWGRAILRFLGSIVSAFPCYLGYIWIIIDKDKQGWHDKIAGTYVVSV
jgi:uncharacterized RDD family membrane protein YckC